MSVPFIVGTLIDSIYSNGANVPFLDVFITSSNNTGDISHEIFANFSWFISSRPKYNIMLHAIQFMVKLWMQLHLPNDFYGNDDGEIL